MNPLAEIEGAARSALTMPSVRDSIEVAIAGAAVGALLGWLDSRSKEGAFKYAKWGAGVGVAGQYMVFHMLKPSLRGYAVASSYVQPQYFHRGF